MTAFEVFSLAVTIYFLILFSSLMVLCVKIDKLLKTSTDAQKVKDLKIHNNGTWHGHCPSCGRYVEFAQKHCCYCTQLLDWTEVIKRADEEE